MSDGPDASVEVLRALWAADDDAAAALDETCAPQKTCRNMKDVSFEGFADEGVDLPTAWRTVLEREGKLGGGQGSIRDLVLGPEDGR